MCCPNRDHHREPYDSQIACPTQLTCSHPSSSHWTGSTWQLSGWDACVAVFAFSTSYSVSNKADTHQVEFCLAKAKQ